ncbi:LpqB family beta-propeller domain-containing protein [Streptomyces sp. P1-3]|uniref:LpqB family beta-propeller domain-containing protein n=1 Tax=Streptomyces sp. P1-3 TaxID=3421658 RepID=UPI003D366902
MAADRQRRPRVLRSRRYLGTPALLACGALVLTGCASMPGSGDVNRVDSSPPGEIDSQVRVYGVRPGAGEQPPELVSGFLEATTSDEENFGTAKMYLTGGAAENWDPFAAVTVLAQAPKITVTGDRDSDGVTVELSGTQLAEVDAHHAYEPREKPYKKRLHVAKSGSEWRIDSLPPGVIMVESDFQRIYHSVNKYYFAKLGPDAETSRVIGEEVLVADPVYVRERIDPITWTVKALLDGPTNWLDPVVRTAFPTGAALHDAKKKLSLDGSNGLDVRLNDKASHVNEALCRQMAAQVLFTVQDQASAQLSSVRLEGPDGSELCELSRDGALVYAPDSINGRAEHQYFVDERHRVMRLSDPEGEAAPVPGPLGEDTAQLRAVAVARDERLAAGVSRDGRNLYVTGLEPGAERGDAQLRSRAGGARNGLSAPSWDGLGGLWVADRDPGRPRLLRLHSGITEGIEEVRIPQLDGRRIEMLRVSADGMRIVLLVERDGHTELLIGRIERRGTADKPDLSVEGLRPVAPRLEEVDAVSWAGGSRLVVAGRESQGVQQLQYVETDGSPANLPAPPSPNRVEMLAASEVPGKPLVAESMDGIVRLPQSGSWKTVADEGSSPVYPG